MSSVEQPPTVAQPAVDTQPRVVRDHRARLHADTTVVTGGAPWGLVRLARRARPFVRRLWAAGDLGVVPSDDMERAVAGRLVERGVAHPLVVRRAVEPGQVQVVVPAHDRLDLLATCLTSLRGFDVTVVDDASADSVGVRRTVESHGCALVRHATNRGPAAARNTGIAATTAPVVAFVDSDCMVPRTLLSDLVGHFDDERVGAVAPRVRPRPDDGRGRSLVTQHEDARSALDMGGRPALVRSGSPLGFVPSATILLRRSALADGGFDEALRLGEDVDLVWRLADAGWLVRYDPAVTVHHAMRPSPRAWAGRRFDYGTSAADLDRRHPGRLAPARLSGWNLGIAAALLAGRPRTAVAIAASAVGLLGRRLGRRDVPRRLAARVVGTGLVADAAAVGHALRREWWPLGWVAMAAAGRSRTAAAGATAMLAPIALEYIRTRPSHGPLPYTLLRLVEDAAYGAGAIASSLRSGRPAPLLPQVRWPGSSS